MFLPPDVCFGISPPPLWPPKTQALGIQRVELVNVWLLSGVRVLYGKRRMCFFSKIHGSVGRGILGLYRWYAYIYIMPSYAIVTVDIVALICFGWMVWHDFDVMDSFDIMEIIYLSKKYMKSQRRWIPVGSFHPEDHGRFSPKKRHVWFCTIPWQRYRLVCHSSVSFFVMKM